MLGQFGWVVLWENFVSFKLINNNRGMEMSDFKWDDHALGTLVMGLGALWQAVGKQWNGYVNALREKCSPIHQFDTAARQMWMWMSCSWLNCHFEMKKNANLCIWDKRKFAIVIKQAVQHSDGITILFWILIITQLDYRFAFSHSFWYHYAISWSNRMFVIPSRTVMRVSRCQLLMFA